MPTPIVSGQKTAFLAMVNALNPTEALRLNGILVNYSDIPNAIAMFTKYPDFLNAGMACFAANDSDLRAAGIYVNTSLEDSPPITDPVMLVNTSSPYSLYLTISALTIYMLGTTNANDIVVLADVSLNLLFIGAGSTVNILDSTATDAIVNIVDIDYRNDTPAALNSIAYGSTVTTVNVSPGSYYGGIKNINPETKCDLAVVDLAIGAITYNTVFLRWTPPDNFSPPEVYLQLLVFYRKTGSEVWLPVDNTTGEYVGNAGYVFRTLDKDTLYDFMVSVTCINGGTCSSVISSQTVCCGNGPQDNDATQEFTAQGDTAFNVEVGNELHSISMFPQGTETINIGTTPGGTDILDAATVTTDGYVLIADRTFSLTLQTTLYVTGATGIVTYRIIEL